MIAVGVVLVCVGCDARTPTDLDFFDDLPIQDWWESKGRRCVRCRSQRRAGRSGRRDRGSAPLRPAPSVVLLLPAAGTQMRVVFDLLLTRAEDGASVEELAVALGRPAAVVLRHLEELWRDELVEEVPGGVSGAWRVTTKART